ncbi:SLBB domain-containing protein [candidate division WOR-3 bacterium]|nr:SLBB domain-containing protein [candidate division WOR-3 bacterium]
MIKRNYILSFLIIFCFGLTTSIGAQRIDRNLLERIQKERAELEKEAPEKVEEKILPTPIEVESLSTIEKMFKERYFITTDRRKFESIRDSLIESVRSESIKIEIRGRYLSSDTLYFQLRSELSKIEKKLDSISITIRQFGYNMFKVTLTEMPSFTPIAEDYLLGPGDEVTIEISGQMNEAWDKRIDRDGKIVLPKVGQITLWGKTYKDAKETIEKALKREFTNIEVSVTLGELRSVNLFVLGEVKNPGLYNVIALSNPLSALFTAGGLKKTGSLRLIKYIPNKGETRIFDLYDLLIEGRKLPNIQLEAGDIIYVPPIGDIVGVTGAVTRPGIYEINGFSDLSDMLQMSGGILPTGGIFRIQIERVSKENRKVVEDFRFQSDEEFRKKTQDIKIRNGDLIELFEIPPLRHNYVIIEGNIERTGTYGLEKGMTVLDLIEEAGGLKEGTYLDRADIFRFQGVENREIIELDLEKTMEKDSKENIKLKEWDKLKIYSIDEIQERFTVTISGAVKYPGTYPLSPDITVNDLLFKGIPLRGVTERAELFSLDPDLGVSIKTISLSDSIDLKIKLKPKDHLLVKRKPAYREVGYVNLLGEFIYPGTYPIKTGEPMKNVIERAGGFTNEAYPDGARFKRKSVAELQNKAVLDLIRETRLRLIAEQRRVMEGAVTEQERLSTMQYLQNQQIQIEELSRMPSPGRVVIDLRDPAQLNTPLEDGDSLFVPKLPKTVQVIGHVYNPTGITYEEGLTQNDYLNMAGGPKKTADKKAIYVRRASGKVVRNPREIKPGDTIIVPEKVEIGRDFWDIVSTTATILYQIGIAVAAFTVFTK